jgi:hypothetical protein
MTEALGNQLIPTHKRSFLPTFRPTSPAMNESREVVVSYLKVHLSLTFSEEPYSNVATSSYPLMSNYLSGLETYCKESWKSSII